MGDVIYVDADAGLKWEKSRETLTDSLMRIGVLFGDDEKLLRAKADRAHGVIRKIVEDVPALDLAIDIPGSISDDQCELIRETVRAAACRGIDTAVIHSVEVITNALYDLCTSKLELTSRRPDTL
jgi:hypothetical protein